MQKATMLFCHLGECSDTSKDPIALWPSEKYADIDLAEKKRCILNHDNWLIIHVDKWAIETVEFPDWIDPAQYATNSTYRVSLKFFRGRMAAARLDESTLNFTREQVNRILPLSSLYQLAIFQLLKVKNFRSAFRASLRDQLEKWLSGQSAHQSPFSARQWQALTDRIPPWEVKNIDERIYWTR